MNDTPQTGGKVFYTLAKQAERDHEFGSDLSPINGTGFDPWFFFNAQPNTDIIAYEKIEPNIRAKFSAESISIREYFNNLFLSNSKQVADTINMLVKYRREAGDDKMDSVVNAVRHDEGPFDNRPNSKAHKLGKMMPVIPNINTFADFLRPSLKKVANGRFNPRRGDERPKPEFKYGALPLMKTFDLMISARKGQNESWTKQLSFNPKWFWIATAFVAADANLNPKLKNPIFSSESDTYLRVSAYVFGDYFKNLGFGENTTADDVVQFGYKLAQSYDYASTLNALLLIKECAKSSYFSQSELNKVKLSYEDIIGVLDYPSRLDENLRLSDHAPTQAEIDLKEILQKDTLKNWIVEFANRQQYNTAGGFQLTSVNTLETTADNEFTLREKTGTFVKNVILDGVAREAGMAPIPVPA